MTPIKFVFVLSFVMTKILIEEFVNALVSKSTFHEDPISGNSFRIPAYHLNHCIDQFANSLDGSLCTWVLIQSLDE